MQAAPTALVPVLRLAPLQVERSVWGSWSVQQVLWAMLLQLLRLPWVRLLAWLLPEVLRQLRQVHVLLPLRPF